MTELLFVLAQTATTQPVRQPSATESMLPMIAIFGAVAVFMIIMNRGKRKERDRYEQMLRELKRNDRVQTIGGILGTVVDVRDNEVVLKVDESSNVKIRFNRTAIKEVLTDASPPAAAETKK